MTNTTKTLDRKIDFSVVIRVEGANPNGDPLNNNRPRVMDFCGAAGPLGQITDVNIKHKIRMRAMEAGQRIFVQSDSCADDGYTNLRDRAAGVLGKDGVLPENELREKACQEFFDVRAFGQLFAWKDGKKTPKKGKKDIAADNDVEDVKTSSKGVSVGIRGPVTVRDAYSVEPITIIETQITKSVNGQAAKGKDGEISEDGGMSSDRMGTKYSVPKAIYVFHGSINPHLADKTGFSYEDALVIKAALLHLFENDESSARPAGSMEVMNVLWWEHNSKKGQHSPAKVHHALHVDTEGGITVDPLDGLKPEILAGW